MRFAPQRGRSESLRNHPPTHLSWRDPGLYGPTGDVRQRVKRRPFIDSKKRAHSFGGRRGLVAFFPNFEAENQGNELTDTMCGLRMTLKLERNRHPFQMFPLM